MYQFNLKLFILTSDSATPEIIIMALVVVDKSKSPVDIEAKPGLVGGKYYVDKRVGEGSFGVIYKGKNTGNMMAVIVDNFVYFCLYTGVECRGNYRVAIKFVRPFEIF